jgi:hypothetical protein
VRREFRDQRTQTPFVLGVAERKEKADRGRFHAALDERRDRAARGGFVELDEHAPVENDALRDFCREVRRHERRRLLEKQVVGRAAVGAALLADFVNAAKAFSDEQTDLGAFLFEDGIGSDGRAVRKERDVRRIRTAAREIGGGAVDDAVGLMPARRRNLEDRDRAGRLVEDDEVGERSAGVDGNAQATQGRRPASNP